jgi:lysosomal Pro-X carboxypeptidase
MLLVYVVLAAWFRMKYSHLAIGALASSAPILFMDDMIQPNAYFDVVSRDFKVIYIIYILFTHVLCQFVYS